MIALYNLDMELNNETEYGTLNVLKTSQQLIRT